MHVKEVSNLFHVHYLGICLCKVKQFYEGMPFYLIKLFMFNYKRFLSCTYKWQLFLISIFFVISISLRVYLARNEGSLSLLL